MDPEEEEVTTPEDPPIDPPEEPSEDPPEEESPAFLTGEEVISGIATNARAAFTTAQIAAIYKDTPKQNVVKPYLFLHQINAEHTNELKGSARLDFLVDVRAHPTDTQTNVNTWARSVANILQSAINTITVSNQTVKSRVMNWKVEEGVLHFIVGYQYRVREVPGTIADMETLTYGTNIK